MPARTETPECGPWELLGDEVRIVCPEDHQGNPAAGLFSVHSRPDDFETIIRCAVCGAVFLQHSG